MKMRILHFLSLNNNHENTHKIVEKSSSSRHREKDASNVQQQKVKANFYFQTEQLRRRSGTIFALTAFVIAFHLDR